MPRGTTPGEQDTVGTTGGGTTHLQMRYTQLGVFQGGYGLEDWAGECEDEYGETFLECSNFVISSTENGSGNYALELYAVENFTLEMLDGDDVVAELATGQWEGDGEDTTGPVDIMPAHFFVTYCEKM